MRIIQTKVAPLAALLVIVSAAGAMAQSAETQGSAAGTAQAQTSARGNAQSASLDPAATAKSKSEADPKLAAILEHGAQTSAKARAEADAKIQASVNEVNEKAVNEGNAKVAERLAAEFGMSAEAVTAEKQSLGLSWGDLMIAHTLVANQGSNLSLADLVQMKEDHNGWGQIAAGMGFKLGEVVSAAHAESRVAAGHAKPDGRVPALAANAAAKSSSGLDVHGAGVNAGAAVKSDVHVKVKP